LENILANTTGLTNITGRVVRISGPIIHASGMSGSGLFDVVEVGEKHILGEIVRIEGDVAVVQVYEDDTGLAVGDPAVTTGRPLSVELGPGLIGTIYDGIERPLESLYREHGAFMAAGSSGDALDRNKKWRFVPDAALSARIRNGEKVEAKGGMIIGEVAETRAVVCKIMVPPLGISGVFTELADEGDYDVRAVIARIGTGREIKLSQWWPVRKPRPSVKRLGAEQPLLTGQRVIDVFFPLSKGGTAAIPGGFGTGKTMTQHAVAKWCDAGVIIYIGCGERGNEMTDVLTEFPELVDPRTGRSLMERTILIANTSNMPVAAREVSIYTGVTLAEYYRDMGYDVAIMADSTSRWAEALRELSGRMEEMPAEEGFPAYLPTRLAEFYERSGRVETLAGNEGSISIIGAVSPPGGDFSEPVTQHTKRFIRCFWALDRELANARHYPAISWIDSYSEYAGEVRSWWETVNTYWDSARSSALELLKKEQRLAEIVRLIGADALPDDQKLILITADLIKNGFLQQNSFDDVDMYCSPAKQVGILSLIMEFYEKSLALLKGGVTMVQINELPFREQIARLKSEIKNDDEEALSAFGEEMRKTLDSLRRR
jgi:V/A-type H+-transporting ATPase subunit A